MQTAPQPATATAEPVLELDELRTYFDTRDGVVKAVDGLSFALRPGEILGVVGESGCGKSITSLSIMQLVPRPPARFAGGEIRFRGRNLLEATTAEMRAIRGNEISMIFQDPMSSLNPVLTIGDQLTEAIILHQGLSERAAMGRAKEMLDLVHIPEPQRRLKEYPHQLSGGMRQRVMIAMALACDPSVLIADEPTTALDVTIQAQILDLMRKLQAEIGMSILFITHDLGVIAEMADRVVVMYAGRAVEEADVVPIFKDPKMPYTLGLMNSIPRVDRAATIQQRLQAIPGNVPNPLSLPPGCAFHPRCRYIDKDRCVQDIPALEDSGDGHMVRCVRHKELSLKEDVAV